MVSAGKTPGIDEHQGFAQYSAPGQPGVRVWRGNRVCGVLAHPDRPGRACGGTGVEPCTQRLRDPVPIPTALLGRAAKVTPARPDPTIGKRGPAAGAIHQRLLTVTATPDPSYSFSLVEERSI